MSDQKDDEENFSGSEPSDTEQEDVGEEYVAPPKKFVPPPPPPRKKGVPTPEDDLKKKMKLVIHNIAGTGGKNQITCEEEMAKSWDFNEEEEKETIKDETVKTLLDDKFRQMAKVGNLAALKFFSSKGADTDGTDRVTGNTALLNAVGQYNDFDSQKKIVEFLMEKGCDCDARNKYDINAKALNKVSDVGEQLAALVRNLDISRKK